MTESILGYSLSALHNSALFNRRAASRSTNHLLHLQVSRGGARVGSNHGANNVQCTRIGRSWILFAVSFTLRPRAHPFCTKSSFTVSVPASLSSSLRSSLQPTRAASKSCDRLTGSSEHPLLQSLAFRAADSPHSPPSVELFDHVVRLLVIYPSRTTLQK